MPLPEITEQSCLQEDARDLRVMYHGLFNVYNDRGMYKYSQPQLCQKIVQYLDQEKQDSKYLTEEECNSQSILNLRRKYDLFFQEHQLGTADKPTIYHWGEKQICKKLAEILKQPQQQEYRDSVKKLISELEETQNLVARTDDPDQKALLQVRAEELEQTLMRLKEIEDGLLFLTNLNKGNLFNLIFAELTELCQLASTNSGMPQVFFSPDVDLARQQLLRTFIEYEDGVPRLTAAGQAQSPTEYYQMQGYLDRDGLLLPAKVCTLLNPPAAKASKTSDNKLQKLREVAAQVRAFLTEQVEIATFLNEVLVDMEKVARAMSLDIIDRRLTEMEELMQELEAGQDRDVNMIIQQWYRFYLRWQKNPVRRSGLAKDFLSTVRAIIEEQMVCTDLKQSVLAEIQACYSQISNDTPIPECLIDVWDQTTTFLKQCEAQQGPEVTAFAELQELRNEMQQFLDIHLKMAERIMVAEADAVSFLELDRLQAGVQRISQALEVGPKDAPIDFDVSELRQAFADNFYNSEDWLRERTGLMHAYLRYVDTKLDKYGDKVSSSCSQEQTRLTVLSQACHEAVETTDGIPDCFWEMSKLFTDYYSSCITLAKKEQKESQLPRLEQLLQRMSQYLSQELQLVDLLQSQLTENVELMLSVDYIRFHMKRVITAIEKARQDKSVDVTFLEAEWTDGVERNQTSMGLKRTLLFEYFNILEAKVGSK